MLIRSVTRHRTQVQGTQEPLTGKGITDGEKSTQAGVSEQTSTRPDMKDFGGNNIGGDTVWRRAFVIWTKGTVRVLLEAGQQTGNDNYRHALISPIQSSSTLGRFLIGGITAQQRAEKIQLKTPSSTKNTVHERHSDSSLT